jgi:hypothetical protein
LLLLEKKSLLVSPKNSKPNLLVNFKENLLESDSDFDSDSGLD